MPPTSFPEILGRLDALLETEISELQTISESLEVPEQTCNHSSAKSRYEKILFFKSYINKFDDLFGPRGNTTDFLLETMGCMREETSAADEISQIIEDEFLFLENHNRRLQYAVRSLEMGPNEAESQSLNHSYLKSLFKELKVALITVVRSQLPTQADETLNILKVLECNEWTNLDVETDPTCISFLLNVGLIERSNTLPLMYRICPSLE